MKPVRRTKETMSDVDAYYADILDIPAYRDANPNMASTRMQILRLQNPSPLGLRVSPQGFIDSNVYTDSFFNNDPNVQNYEESGAPRRFRDGRFSVTNTSQPASAFLPPPSEDPKFRMPPIWTFGLARCALCRTRR